VGITRYCIHPPEARQKAEIVGGTKSPRFDVVRSLEPELVLANQEENRKEDITAFRAFTTVHVSFPRSVSSAIDDILTLGRLLGQDEMSRRLAKALTRAIEDVRERSRGCSGFRYLYFIWRNPYMAAGPGTFIDAFLAEVGGINAMGSEAKRYPEITPSRVAELRPDVVFLSSEPFPFRSEHIGELVTATPGFPGLENRVLLVDGELLSWHGVRLRKGIPYLSELADRVRSLVIKEG
jgi:ABC-type Fe3+-hydroxamate transport system substrate-binding protein